MGVDSCSSVSQSLDFTDNPPIVVPKNIGTLNLEVEGLSPNTTDTRARVKWCVQRNPDDILTGPDPVLSVTSSDPPQATLGTDTQGSFNVIVFCDPNGSDDYTQGKILVVLNVAIVLVSLLNNVNSLAPTSSNFGVVETTTRYIFYTGAGLKPGPAISFGAGTFQVLVQGGGDDAMLGADKITVGWLGNVTSHNPKALYPPTVTGGDYESWIVGGSPPLPPPYLDTDRDDPGTGGSTAFRSSSQYTPVPDAPPPGITATVTATDSPHFYFDILFPDTSNHGTSVGGGVAYKDFLSCFSSDFLNAYSALGMVVWSFTYAFTWNAATSTWDVGSSCVSGPTAIVDSGFPMSAAAAGAAVVPPTIQSVKQFVTVPPT